MEAPKCLRQNWPQTPNTVKAPVYEYKLVIFKHKQQISTNNRQQSKSKEQRRKFYSGSAISGLRPLQSFYPFIDYP